ncbi:MAG: hypothetical protein AAF184_22435 [Pseudomonadota bacterium]
MTNAQAGIRVLVREHPLIDARLERVLGAAQPQRIVLTGHATDSISVLLALRADEADAVVIADEQPDKESLVNHLMTQFPDVTVIALAANGDVWLEQRCPNRWRLGDRTAGDLAGALVAAVLNPCERQHPSIN